MVMLTTLLLAVHLTGVWTTERTFSNGDGLRPERWVWVGRPPVDSVHLRLYIERGPDGALTAFVRNPEYNLGAFIGPRTVAIHGALVRLMSPHKPEIAGRYDSTADKLTLHFTEPAGDFVFRRSLPDRQAYRYSVPPQTGDGWRTGSLQSSGIDPAAITAAIGRYVTEVRPALKAPYVQSLLIARHGKLVLDAYFNGFYRERPHDVRSAGKSITTLLLGRAIEDGANLSLQTRVYDLLSNYAPFAHFDRRKAVMTAGDLMSMQSGYACDDNDDTSPGNEDTMQSQRAQPDWYKYTLDLPMAIAPGTRGVYCSADINLLGAVIVKAAKRRLTDYFFQRFAQPMQFGTYGMWLMPPPVNEAYMAGGDYFLPRDFLKFGELFLEHGAWNGKHVIDERWLQTISVKRSTIADGGGDYGYGWHLSSYTVGGKGIQAINAGGNGGQLLFVFPQLDMTVMITAANYGQYGVWRMYSSDLVPQILSAVRT